MTTSQKILICGYSHCGTTILKSIIGHIEDVEEIIDECESIDKSTNKKYIMCKCSKAKSKFFGQKYKDYIKIFIIRNPLFVFSSINKRKGDSCRPNEHSIDKYINIVKMFIKYKNNPEKNIYTIKYEDLFKNNLEDFKKLLNDIGFKYDNSIFDNSKYTNKSHSRVPIVKNKPKNTDHKLYRNWQINQPFKCQNYISKIDLSDSQKEKIINNSYILQIYPDMKEWAQRIQQYEDVKRKLHQRHQCPLRATMNLLTSKGVK